MRKATLYTVGIAALVAVFILLAERTAVYQLLQKWSLLPRLEPLTELYFVEPLPRLSYIAPGSDATFSFTLHNLEGVDTKYLYRVYVKAEETVVPIAEGTTTLMNEERQTISVPYVFRTSPERAVFYVEIVEPRSQHIHFSIPPGT